MFLSPFLNSAECTFPSSPPKKYRQCHQAVDPGDMYYGRCCNVVLNLCTLALQTLDCRVLSGNNNHNKLILFQRQMRPEYILSVKWHLLYHYEYFEIKASSCFHRFFVSKAIACTITLIFDQG